MKHVFVFLLISGSLFLGCNNPFSGAEESRIIGVWAPQVGIGPKNIAFLNQGRYWEEDIQVGVYTIIKEIYQGDRSDYTVNIRYNDGTNLQVVVFTTEETLKISIGNSTGRGPTGVYNRLHSGDGL